MSGRASRRLPFMTTPTPELDARYSAPGASATPWSDVEALLRDAELFWLATVRPGGGPHMTPLLGVYDGGALHFCTGRDEQKSRNMAGNPKVLMSTGCNSLHSGVDVVLEATAVRVTDDARLRQLASVWEAKYGADWHFDVDDGAFAHDGGAADVYRLEPSVVYAFSKSAGTHTRYRSE